MAMLKSKEWENSIRLYVHKKYSQQVNILIATLNAKLKQL